MYGWLVQAEAQQAQARSSPFASPDGLLEDPPMGEGWDEHGNDLSKAANDVSFVSFLFRFCFLFLLSGGL